MSNISPYIFIATDVPSIPNGITADALGSEGTGSRSGLSILKNSKVVAGVMPVYLWVWNEGAYFTRCHCLQGFFLLFVASIAKKSFPACDS